MGRVASCQSVVVHVHYETAFPECCDEQISPNVKSGRGRLPAEPSPQVGRRSSRECSERDVRHGVALTEEEQNRVIQRWSLTGHAARIT